MNRGIVKDDTFIENNVIYALNVNKIGFGS